MSTLGHLCEHHWKIHAMNTENTQANSKPQGQPRGGGSTLAGTGRTSDANATR